MNNMCSVDPKISSALRDFEHSNITDSTIDALRWIVNEGLASQLMRLLTNEKTQAQGGEQLIYKIMANLEQVADKKPALGCILMIDLLVPASELQMHDVCDAIGLWIWHNNSSEIQKQIQRAASLEPDLGMRQHLEKMVSGLSGEN